LTLYVLILVTHAHLWLGGVNTFVKICYYVDPTWSSYKKYYERKRYVVHPDAYCPPQYYAPPIAGKDSNDFEEFMALERIREAEKELTSMMKLYGRPGLHDDWVRYLAEARRERREAEAQRKKDIEKMWEYVAWGIAGIVGIGGCIGLILWVKFLRDGGL
jgi:hypothetical protein